MIPFVALGLAVCDKLNVQDKQTQMVVMRFCKIYNPSKVARIVERTKTYPWWEKNIKAAFMKAVGEVNREEKNGQINQAR